MASRPKRPCAHAGCGALVTSGLCRVHQNMAERAEAMSDSRAMACRRNEAYNQTRDLSDGDYNLARWKKLRAAKRGSEPLCELCRQNGRITVATMVDHIVPVKQGGAMWDWKNLQSLCHRCHRQKTADDLRRRNMRTDT